jgi:sporulation protein YlmC with PRC-barrel domain
MKRSIKNLTGYTIRALDGPKGKVKDFLLDEERWVIRYLEADFGNLFKKKRVLIPRVFMLDPEWENEEFPVNISKEEVEDCPDLEEHMPVSREYEKELSRHYRVDFYWADAYSAAAAARYFPPRPLRIPSRKLSEKELDTSLRSFREVEGYTIRAIDDTLGHVEDLIVDDDDWQVVYLIVDTSNWRPWSKKVLLPLEFIKEISYVDRKVAIALHTGSIKGAPEYDVDKPVDMDYEKALYDFYKNIK